MVMFVLSILLTIGAFVGLGFYRVKSTDRYGDDEIGWKINKRQPLALLCLILIVFGCMKSVPTGSTGIVTTFGKVHAQTLDAGIHFMAPWDKVIKMDNRTQKAQVELSCFSRDIQEVKVIYTINYQINKSNAQELYKTVGTNYYDTVIVPRVQECVKAAFAQYTAESLIADRNAVARAIELDLSESLLKYNIDLGDTAIEDVDFSDSFTNAAEAKVTAQQDKLTAQTKSETAIIQAEADAKKKTIDAQAEADAGIIKAQGDAEVAKISADSAEYQGQKDAAIMSNLGEMLTKYPNLIDYYRATGWDGKLPETMLGGDTSVILGQ